jgi:hypothetical protein
MDNYLFIWPRRKTRHLKLCGCQISHSGLRSQAVDFASPVYPVVVVYAFQCAERCTSPKPREGLNLRPSNNVTRPFHMSFFSNVFLILARDRSGL